MKYKGIVLAGGKGSRLYPITKGVSKQLLPVYDKPMIFYPLSVLMLSGIREILIITTSCSLSSFKSLLGNGSRYGINLSYEVQNEPNGIAEAFIIGEHFIGQDHVALVLGDNLFYGQGFLAKLKSVMKNKVGATIFGYQVKDPERFGVVEFNDDKKVISIEEKPLNAKSSYAVTGLYFYDNKVINIAKNLTPSERGELEITDINKSYLARGELNVEIFGRGFTWLDTGTHDSLLEAGQFVHTIEQRQGLKIACLEEIAYRQGWLNRDELLNVVQELGSSSYSEYLKSLDL
ncbi:glucose-1-phosphate thymidylyltransferase RfbA [Pseudoalteromonas sp. C2R02]|uniref:glucose-1-phosphate thymidylyltransferase RfbA n=1 Tax=Pseudoalteromonas sp. C2R02 TaxID=2841565 RepID=UPI001C088F29|nr:glucose-1-phosphate thymidylyltransferase RfbA [Pseudoalteromonas sp. C2R02]MBU2971736.1 glucose-1-phosphate thymidylyltransferase RfbA [Pseudoalteromonas sp. C2R02]